MDVRVDDGEICRSQEGSSSSRWLVIGSKQH